MEKKELKYVGPKTAIHCPTQQEADKVSKILEEAGLSKGKSLGHFWSYSREKFCINPEDDTRGTIAYYESQNFAIIPAATFIAANTAPRNLEGVQVGDRVILTIRNKWGTVAEIMKYANPLYVRWDDGSTGHYSMGGYLSIEDETNGAMPVICFAMPECSVFPTRPVPKWEPEPFEVCWAKMHRDQWKLVIIERKSNIHDYYVDVNGNSQRVLAPFDKSNPTPPES